VDQIIARLAARRHGVVTRVALLDAGVSKAEIRTRLARGALIPIHPGVYRVGHAATSAHADYVAAVLACGPHAVLGGFAASWLWSVIRSAPPVPEVIAPTQHRLKGVTTRRCRLTPRERTIRHAIPATTLPRTIVDLAGRLDEPALARVFHEAHVRHRLRPEPVEAVLALHPNLPGAGALRRVLRGDVQLLLSKLESAFIALLEAEGLPLPITNRPENGRYLDCTWPDHRLVVELDSYAFHATRHAWEEDRRRERHVRAEGYEFRRYTYEDVAGASPLMLAELRGLLTARP
jgi:hypothetical protein